MPELKQGEIWWAQLPEPIGRRPACILTRSNAIRALHNVTIAPLTRTIRGIPSEVVLSPADHVPSLCAISLENILTIRKTSLETRITQLDAERMHEVFASIRYVFDMK